MLAERIVSLSWRLKRVERMNSEAIDVMIACAETDSWQMEQREEAGLLDPEAGRSELVLGWATIRDFSNSNVLERLLLYEKRIESSLYKVMNELEKLQRVREHQPTKPVKVEPVPESCRAEDVQPKKKEQTQYPTSPPSTPRRESINIASLSDCCALSANSAVNEKTKPKAGP